MNDSTSTPRADTDPAEMQGDDLLESVTGGLRGLRVMQKPLPTAWLVGRPSRPVLAIDED